MDPRLQDRYYALVKAFIAQPGEAPLAATAELGRELVRADVPIEEIGELQERTLERLARDLPDSVLDAATHLYSVPLTELVLLGVMAIRSGKSIEWDPKTMKVTNFPEANAWVKEPVHDGWSYGEKLWNE